MNCKCCNSVYLDEINSLLRRGVSTRKISQYLKDQYDFKVTHNSISLHRRNHLLTPIQTKDDTIRLLYDTGNYRLAKRIMRTQKIIKQYSKCLCNPFEDRPLKKRGLVFICTLCNGWLRGDVGRSVTKDQRRKRREDRSKERLAYVVKRHRRRFL